MTEGSIERGAAERQGRVSGLLSRQLELLGQLDALSERQAGLIEASEADRLLGLLAERQRILDDLEAVRASFEPYRADWAGAVVGVEAEAVRSWEAQLSAIARTGRSIAERDARDAEALASARSALLAKLGGLGENRRAMRAYGPRAVTRPRLEDREG